MSSGFCWVCGGELAVPGVVFSLETSVEWGHVCDGSEAMCARTCPVEIPVPVERAEPCPNPKHGTEPKPDEIPF